MKQKQPEYNFIKDPHLAYFIQSPYKIAQLLKSRRYKLKGNYLVQIDTNDVLEIDSSVLKRLDKQQISKMSEFDNLNEKVMQLIQNGCNVEEKFHEFRKSNSKFSHQLAKSPVKGPKSTQKSVHNTSLPYIKGLKQFKLKIL